MAAAAAAVLKLRFSAAGRWRREKIFLDNHKKKKKFSAVPLLELVVLCFYVRVRLISPKHT